MNSIPWSVCPLAPFFCTQKSVTVQQRQCGTPFPCIQRALAYTLNMNSITSLAQFTVCSKNTCVPTVHPSTRGLMTFLLIDIKLPWNHPRQSQSTRWLDDCFYSHISRKVHKDFTIKIDKVCYDGSMQFTSAKLNIRYLPNDISSAFILSNGKKFPSTDQLQWQLPYKTQQTTFLQSTTPRLEMNPDAQLLLQTYLQPFC